MIAHLPFITVSVLIVAFLYSSVGHAGASGYIAVMSLFGMAPEAIKPMALRAEHPRGVPGHLPVLRAGHFSWKLFWPFALLSAPLAFFGGLKNLPTEVFNKLVGLVLLFSAARFFIRPPEEQETHEPSRPVAIGVGGGLGLLSGLTGTGGGIFLTPLLIFMRWAPTKTASAISAAFILVNSIAGLSGNLSATKAFPSFAWPLAAAALVGGFAGSYLGSQRFPAATIKRLLAVVLVIAGLKLLIA